MLPYQLVCEGKADQVFFSRMLAASGKSVDVLCPQRDDPNGGMGKSAIHKVLIGLQAQFDKLSRVVVVFDSDENPVTALSEAKEQFAKANACNPAKPYPIPNSVNSVATLNGSPDTAIVLVPGNGRKGCLDTLLLPSFEAAINANMACVNAFCTCMNDPTRGLTKDSTLRLRILIASAYPKKPGVSLAYLMEEGHGPVDLAHQSFDEIRAVLTKIFS